MISVEVRARMTAVVESGKMKRQQRVVSIGGRDEGSLKRKKSVDFRVTIRDEKPTKLDRFSIESWWFSKRDDVDDESCWFTLNDCLLGFCILPVDMIGGENCSGTLIGGDEGSSIGINEDTEETLIDVDVVPASMDNCLWTMNALELSFVDVFALALIIDWRRLDADVSLLTERKQIIWSVSKTAFGFYEKLKHYQDSFWWRPTKCFFLVLIYLMRVIRKYTETLNHHWNHGWAYYSSRLALQTNRVIDILCKSWYYLQ